jgi:hypothetical protein
MLSFAASIGNSMFINNNEECNIKDVSNKNMIIKCSVIINFTLCVIASVLYIFEINQKELFFKIYSDNYLRLNNTLTTEMFINKNINNEFIKFIIYEYTFLIENTRYEIPTFIKKYMKKDYYNYNIPPFIDAYVDNISKLTNLKNRFSRFTRVNVEEQASKNYIIPVLKQYVKPKDEKRKNSTMPFLDIN